MKINVMLDSGAYSALHAGKKITPEEYRTFVLKNARHVHKVVALDVIPGLHRNKGGGPPRRVTPKESAAASYANWRMLWDADVDVMPVFHRGEDIAFLDRYVEEDADWIGLASRGSDVWLDRIFLRHPRVKFHGFAETRLPVLLAHPWHSVDSRTAIDNAMYSQAFAPRPGDDTLGNVFFGAGDTKYPHKHIRFLPSWEQERIRDLVGSHGFTVAQLEDEDHGTRNRAIYNAIVLDRIVKQHPTNPRLRLFHSVSSPGQDPFGTRAEVPDRLISYAFLGDGEPDDLRKYVRA